MKEGRKDARRQSERSMRREKGGRIRDKEVEAKRWEVTKKMGGRSREKGRMRDEKERKER